MYPVSSHALLQRPAVLLPAAALLLVAAAGVIWADLAARNGHGVPVPAHAAPTWKSRAKSGSSGWTQ